MLHIAWIYKSDDTDAPGKVAEIAVWDPIEHRIEIFGEEIMQLPGGGTGDIVERARALLEQGDFRVHSVEVAPGGGWAAIVESNFD